MDRRTDGTDLIGPPETIPGPKNRLVIFLGKDGKDGSWRLRIIKTKFWFIVANKILKNIGH